MAFALLFMAMGSIHLETKLGITFLMLLHDSRQCLCLFHHLRGNRIPFRRRDWVCHLLFLLSIPIDIWALGLVATDRLFGATCDLNHRPRLD